MDQLVPFAAITFPCDGRTPHLVQLMTSPGPAQSPELGPPPRIPHPEVYMDYIAEGLGHRAWKYHVGRELAPRKEDADLRYSLLKR